MTRACKDFIEMTKLVVKSGVKFSMWSDDDKIGITIEGNDGDGVDIAQYMSPLLQGGKIICIPIGLSIQYTRDGKSTYSEGGDPEERMQEVLRFLNKEDI